MKKRLYTKSLRSGDQLAIDRTDLAFDRTLMAEDRTLMAWIRTTTALVTFGFSLPNLFFVLFQNRDAQLQVYSPIGIGILGLTLIGAGICFLGIASIQSYLRVQQLYKVYEISKKSFGLNLTQSLSVFIMIFGILVFLGLIRTLVRI